MLSDFDKYHPITGQAYIKRTDEDAYIKRKKTDKIVIPTNRKP